MTHSPHDQAGNESLPRRGVPWLLAGPVLVAALAIAGANAPARVKWIGLFAITFGLLSGGMLGLLARDSRGKLSWKSVLTAGLLIAAGEILMGTLSHRIYAKQYEQRFRRHQAELMTAGVPVGAQSGTGNKTSTGSSGQFAQRAQFLEQILGDNTRFSTYLQLRVSALGSWPSPWPTVFWISEVLLGSLSGVWLFRRLTRGKRQLLPGKE